MGMFLEFKKKERKTGLEPATLSLGNLILLYLYCCISNICIVTNIYLHTICTD